MMAVNFPASLSVLALSSRFDGLRAAYTRWNISGLSVLALSSRFDGRVDVVHRYSTASSFSTRSVESF